MKATREAFRLHRFATRIQRLVSMEQYASKASPNDGQMPESDSSNSHQIGGLDLEDEPVPEPLVQFLLLRRVRLSAMQWPVGSVIAQALPPLFGCEKQPTVRNNPPFLTSAGLPRIIGYYLAVP